MKLNGQERVNLHPNKVTENPLVSVSVVTYNHEKYIRECIDGILMQKTDFDFEILVGEDDSQDNTRNICIDYAKRYPDKIRLFLHDRSNVIYINGHPTGRYNMLFNLKEAKGRYIALCEGDDYWTDPLKLQKQVDFLEENKDFFIVGHVILKKTTETTEKIFAPGVFVLKDCIKAARAHTSSLVFRNKIELSSWFKRSPVGDLPLMWLCAERGKFKVFSFIGSVYRYENQGVFSGLNYYKRHLLSAKQYSFMLLHFDSYKWKIFKKVLFFYWHALISFLAFIKNLFIGLVKE